MVLTKNRIGFVKSIFIAAEAGLPMQKVIQVSAEESKGLVGDRYAAQLGFWQTVKQPRKTIRDVSLIRASDIDGSGFSESETRRNIVIQTDFNLLQLIDKYFYIGEVLFKGIEECTPCKRPSELSSKSNFAQVFKDKGGLRALVVTSGLIREKDSVIFAD